MHRCVSQYSSTRRAKDYPSNMSLTFNVDYTDHRAAKEKKTGAAQLDAFGVGAWFCC